MRGGFVFYARCQLNSLHINAYLTVTPLGCILNLCSWIIGRSSVVNLDAITQYISLNTINLNSIRSYLKSWLRKQTLVSKGEYSKLLEASLKIPNPSVTVIMVKPLYAFSHSYWTHSRPGQLLCILLRLCLIAAIFLPDISGKQPYVWKLRLCFWRVLFNRKNYWWIHSRKESLSHCP